jgi:hypothetical protein
VCIWFESSVIYLIWTKKLILLYKLSVPYTISGVPSGKHSSLFVLRGSDEEKKGWNLGIYQLLIVWHKYCSARQSNGIERNKDMSASGRIELEVHPLRLRADVSKNILGKF